MLRWCGMFLFFHFVANTNSWGSILFIGVHFVQIAHSRSHHFKSFTVVNMTWVTVTNICVTNDYGYVSFVEITIRSFPHWWLNTGFCNKSIMRTGTAYPSGAYEFPYPPSRCYSSCYSILSVVNHCLSFYLFFFLLVSVSSVLRLTAFDCPLVTSNCS